MALPLPKVVADVEAGGPFVTSRNAFNNMANSRALRKYNEVKADWAGTTIPAQAYSQMAYANAVAPQFMAKLLQDPKFLGNLSPQQAENIKNAVLSGATKPPGFNALNQGQQYTGIGQPSTNKHSGKLKNAFNQVLDFFTGGNNKPALNPMQQQNMPSTVPQQGGNAFQQPPQATPQSTAPVPNETEADIFNKYIATPEGQAEVDKANRGEPSRLDIGTEALAHELANEAKNATTPGGYIDNAAIAKGALNQGEKLGGIKADMQGDIAQQQKSLGDSGNNIDRLITGFTNPDFIALRNEFPYLQDMQLGAISHLDNPQAQNLAGQIIADIEAFKGSTVMGFKGSTLKREFDYADKLKPSTNDTVYTATGKLQTLKALHDIAVTKNSLIDLYLKDPKITPAQAVEKANKAVDITAIDKRVKELTEPAVKIDNPKTKASMWITVKRAKELGFTKDQAKKFGLKYE
jgi:hypothetical protein